MGPQHFWIQLHTEPPVPLSEAVGPIRSWTSGEIELSWDDVPGVRAWTIWAVSKPWPWGRWPMRRRDLRGPRHRRTRRMLRRGTW